MMGSGGAPANVAVSSNIYTPVHGVRDHADHVDLGAPVHVAPAPVYDASVSGGPAVPSVPDVFFDPSPAPTPSTSGSSSMNEHSLATPTNNTAPSDAPEAARPSADSIKIEYHPNSGLPPAVSSFEEFNRHRAAMEAEPAPDREPWGPFISRLDYEFAEFTLRAALSKKNINTLLDMVSTLR